MNRFVCAVRNEATVYSRRSEASNPLQLGTFIATVKFMEANHVLSYQCNDK